MFLKKKSPSELESETVAKIYARMTEMNADISKIKGEQERLEQGLKTLRGKVNREASNDLDIEKEKPFIGLAHNGR